VTGAAPVSPSRTKKGIHFPPLLTPACPNQHDPHCQLNYCLPQLYWHSRVGIISKFNTRLAGLIRVLSGKKLRDEKILSSKSVHNFSTYSAHRHTETNSTPVSVIVGEIIRYNAVWLLRIRLPQLTVRTPPCRSRPVAPTPLSLVTSLVIYSLVNDLLANCRSIDVRGNAQGQMMPAANRQAPGNLRSPVIELSVAY